MVLANNIICSRDGNALHFPNGSEGITITGNVLTGNGAKFDNPVGKGIADFTGLTWDSTKDDATPAAGAKLDVADPKFLLDLDFHNKPRGGHRTAGAVGSIR
jgi:hypothetical protein